MQKSTVVAVSSEKVMTALGGVQSHHMYVGDVTSYNVPYVISPPPGCYGYFCLPCLACGVARRLDESCCVPLFLQGGIMATRTKLRTLYGIQVLLVISVYRITLH